MNALNLLERLGFGPEVNAYSCVVLEVIRRVLKGGMKLTGISNDIVNKLVKAYDCNRVRTALREAASLIDEIYRAYSSVLKFAVLIEVRVKTRLAVHTRSPYMPLEIGIAWHPLLNLPYVPSTTVKGVLAAYVELRDVRPCGLAVSDLMGSPSSEGLLVFSDMLPVDCRDKLLDADVVTPHYRELDGLIDEARVRPTPILFPTIAPGTVLRLVIGGRSSPQLQRVRDIVYCAREELPRTIAEAFRYGVGARTLLGYGLLEAELVNLHVRMGDQS